MKNHTFLDLLRICTISLLLMSGLEACTSLSKAEISAARASQDALCRAVVASYRAHDLQAFAELAMSPTQIKKMMAKVQVPEGARREGIKNKQAFVEHMQDSLNTVLRFPEFEWASAEFDKFVQARKPVEIAVGYTLSLGQLRIKSGSKTIAQPFALVTTIDGSYYVGDFGPFENQK